MTTHIFGSSDISNTPRAVLAFDDDLFVAAGATVGNTEGTAIRSFSSEVSNGRVATIDGNVVGGLIGIDLGDDGDSYQNLTVRSTGQIFGHAPKGDYGIGARIFGGESKVDNAGYIYGAQYGLQLDVSYYSTLESKVINSGTIESRSYSIIRGNDGEAIEILNAGIIKGFYAYYCFSYDGVDKITNIGKIYGHISFDGGDDLYDGRAGFLKGDIYAGDGADTLYGGKEANVFHGGGGNDHMAGGGGDDRYSVNDASDKVVEAANEGTDTVEASVTYALSANVENLILYYSADINGTGNALNNTVTGTHGRNTLDGGAGNDTLDGKDGVDTMIGGTGNDTMYIDNAGDIVVEAANGGTDRVISSIGFSLAKLANIENLRLSGAAHIDATGDSLANVIEGNTGSNTLRGNSGNDTLNGAAGNDKLYGGSGADALTGGTGQDIFIFDTGLGVAHVDRIIDFSVADDTIWLDDAVFTKAGRIGDLKASAFHIGSKADDSDDRIIYDMTAGKLFYDADGSGAGAAVQFATIGKNLALTVNDFDVVTAMNILHGGTGSDTLTAGSGNDRIYGNLGADTLTGGAGKDTFVFDTKPSSTNIDTIKDFSVADDTIWLDNAVFNRAGAVGDLKTEAFCVGTKAKDASDRVIYDTATGKLWYDADGNGKSAAIQIALLTKNLSLTANDFDIIG